jgi:hypothetical protein
MAVRQGCKFYAQVLLDPHRYELLEREAQARNMKVTALIRQMVYERLQQDLPASDYRAAEAADGALWAEAVRRRVQGRQRTKQQSV